MAISDRIKRLLWSRSGGFCQNTSCRVDFFTFFEDRSISSIEELAHIIARSDSGPRANQQLKKTMRDDIKTHLGVIEKRMDHLGGLETKQEPCCEMPEENCKCGRKLLCKKCGKTHLCLRWCDKYEESLDCKKFALESRGEGK